MIFDDSDTDIAMAQTVTLFDFWKDGLSSVETQYEFHKAFPQRTMFCGGVDPAFQGLKASLEMMEFQAKEWGAVSFKFYNAHLDGKSWRCDDREIAYPMYRKSLDLGVNLLQFHKGVPIGPANVEDTMPNDLQSAARDFPEANFVIHHLSMPYFEETVSIAAAFRTCISLCPATCTCFLAHCAVQEMMGRLPRDVGAHKLLWGSKHPC
jgi:predicted TIM-barrel fold metal-dependent hydrolase